MQENNRKRRILLIVSYDGTNYHGWQLQPNAVTIEEKLNEAIFVLTGEKNQVIGASRTDAGVHALGNAAVFDTHSRIPAEKFSYALNRILPEDIVIQSSKEVKRSFHPRHCASRKTYEYTILNRTFPLPEYRNYSILFYGILDLEQMNRAAGYLIGEHDFASFCSVGAQVQTTVRTIYAAGFEKQGECLKFRITGNGFLYNMVRIIVGTLLEVGKGRLRPEDLEKILMAKSRDAAGPTAPAKGLKLLEILFEEETEEACGQQADSAVEK